MRHLALVIATLVLAAPAGAAPTPLKATMKTSSTKPVVDAPWRFTVRVTNAAGKPQPGKLRLQILVGVVVVGCWKGSAMTQCTGANAGTWIAFKGKHTGVITWPAQALGIKLTFQAVVRAGKKTFKLRAPVTIQPKP